MGPAAESRARDEKPKDLEVDQDMRFVRRDWRAQRVGWAAMATVVALALSGSLGRGALADVEHTDGDLKVRYDRIARHEARTLVEIEVPANGNSVWLEQSLEERWRVEQITPEPEAVRLEGNRIVYRVNVPAEGGVVRFDLKPERNGRARGRVGVDDASVAVEQWVLP